MESEIVERHAAYREARDAVAPLRRRQAEAETAMAGWLRRHRGVPSHVLYDAETGRPLDAELAALERAVDVASADVRWCRAVEVACAELVKGEPLQAAIDRNAAHRKVRA